MPDTDTLFGNWTPPLPPHTRTVAGCERRIGVELEMIGLGVSDISGIVARQIGGSLRARSRYEHVVLGDVAGEWRIELDYEYLKQKGRAEAPEDELMELLDEAAESVIRRGAEAVVPVEVISPPLPMARLADVQTLIAELRGAGARGSGAGLSYAFGLQLNPELPALDAGTVLAYLKAFLCLYDWLVKRSAPDLTRRLTGYSAPFSGRYARRVVDPDYWPDLPVLIDDYLLENPTRNRALDLLPLFLHLDPDRVRGVVDDPRVKARPTLHYRLPNCEIDLPDWGIHIAWGDWLQVERVAADRAGLDELCASTAAWLDDPLGRLFDDRAKEVQRWLDR